MAKIPRNKKLIEGNYDLLSPEEKKNKIKLNDQFYIAYPLDLEQNKFELKQELMTKSKAEQKTSKATAKAELAKPIVSNDFKASNQNRNLLFENAAALLQKDKRFLLKDSPEMLWVKKSLAGLTNVLDEKLVDKGYLNENNHLQSAEMVARVNAAYDAFFEAAENYINSRKSTSTTATRRRNKIIELLNHARQAKADFNTMVDAAKDKLIDFEHMDEAQRNQVTAGNLVNSATAKEAELNTVEWQNEGNSTDVYRMKLKGEDGFYYLKENLPFIDEDLRGYLERRTAQLNKSLELKLSGQYKQVEERLENADVKEADYQNATTFLTNLKNRIDNEPDATRYAEADRLSVCLAKNFDRVFSDFHKYNESVDIMKQYPEKTIDDLIKDAPDSMTKEILNFQKDYLIKNNLYVPGQTVQMEKKTAAEYVIAEMGLDASKDKAVIDQLKKMDDGAVEKLFRYSLGKEMELYGQMKEKASKNGVREKDESIMAAMNNTASSRIAERYGFGDVITKSKTALVKFQRRDGTMVNKLCTISEEAPGMEYIDVIKKAQKENKKIVYSPEALRNLMRLQANDTLTLQIDRHGRNFKCDIDEVGNTIVINTVKAYDNDMSFGNQKLSDVFKQNEKGETPKYQFLPSLKTKAVPGTAMHKFIMKNYFGVDTSTEVKKEQIQLKAGRYNINVNSSTIPNIMKAGVKFNDVYKFSSDYNLGKVVMKLNGDEKDEYLKENGIKIPANEDGDYEIGQFAKEKYIDIINRINKIWVRDPQEFKSKERKGFDKYLKSDIEKDNLSQRDLKELDEAILELKELNKTFDFSGLGSTSAPSLSVPNLYMQLVIELYDRTIGSSLEHKVRSQSRNPKAVMDLMDKDGSIEIPTMLHYDKEAHEALQKSVIDLGNPQSNAVLELKELGFSQEKIDALRARNQEQLEHIEWAKQKAELFYKAAGWNGKKPQGEFFLNKGDYKEINNLMELSVDPGNTYLAVENDKYLCSLPEYRECMSEKELKEAENYIKAQNNDIKRWKYKPNETKKDLKKSALSNDSNTSSNANEYIKACLKDEEVSRGTDPLTKEQKANSVLKTAFITNFKRGIDAMYNGKHTTAEIKKMMAPGHIERDRYSLDSELNSNMGQLFYKQLVKNVEAKNPVTTMEALATVEQSGKDLQKSVVGACLDSIQNAKSEDMAKATKDAVTILNKLETFVKKSGFKADIKGEMKKICEADPKKIDADKLKQLIEKMDPDKNPKKAELQAGKNHPKMPG